MKKVILASTAFLFSIFTYAQNYPFSVTKSGTGEQSILFIPGFASSGDVWNETINELKDHYTCYTFTMPGFAGVTPEENPSFENWKKQLVQFINDEKIENPILIGHSMGGGLALAIASDYPNLTKKIIVVDALPCLMALTYSSFKSVPKNDCSDKINQVTAMTKEQFVQMQRVNVASLTINSSKINEIVNWGLASDRKTYAKIFCDFSNTDLRERIKHITVPTLVLLESPFKNIEMNIKEQYKNLSTVTLKYANKGLHFVMFDDKEWFINQVYEFIKE